MKKPAARILVLDAADVPPRVGSEKIVEILRLIRMLDEPVDLLVHEVEKHLAALEAEDLFHEAERHTGPSERIDEGERRWQ